MSPGCLRPLQQDRHDPKEHQRPLCPRHCVKDNLLGIREGDAQVEEDQAGHLNRLPESQELKDECVPFLTKSTRGRPALSASATSLSAMFSKGALGAERCHSLPLLPCCCRQARALEVGSRSRPQLDLLHFYIASDTSTTEQLFTTPILQPCKGPCCGGAKSRSTELQLSIDGRGDVILLPCSSKRSSSCMFRVFFVVDRSTATTRSRYPSLGPVSYELLNLCERTSFGKPSTT